MTAATLTIDTNSATLTLDGNTNYVAAQGTVLADSYSSLAAAITACPDGGTVLLGHGPYTSPYQNQSLPTTIPTSVLTKAITLQGIGMPDIAANGASLVTGTGTIVQGSLFCGGDNIKIYDLGIDVGDTYIAASWANVPQEGLIFHDREQLGGAAVSSWDGVEIDNVLVLSSGHNSDVHAFLLENLVNFRIGYIRNVKGGAGVVVKSNNGTIQTVESSGSLKYSLLLKSESYSAAEYVTVGMVTATHYGLTPPTPGVGATYNTNGVVFQASGANCVSNTITTVRCVSTLNGVERVAASGKSVIDCNINSAVLSTIGNYVTISSGAGTVLDCHDRHFDVNVAALGQNFGTTCTRCSFNGTIRSSGHYAYENSGTLNRWVNCASLTPTTGHIRNVTGTGVIQGDLEIFGSAATRVTVLAGSVRQELSATVLDVASDNNAYGIIVGPTSGSQAAGDTTSLGFRVRNSSGGAVAAAPAIGAAVRAVQTDTGANTAGLAFATRSDSSTLTNVMALDDQGNLLLGVAATGAVSGTAKVIHIADTAAPGASLAGGGMLWVEAGALKYRGSSGTVTPIAPA